MVWESPIYVNRRKWKYFREMTSNETSFYLQKKMDLFQLVIAENIDKCNSISTGK